MLLIALMFLGESLSEPMSLSIGRRLVHKRGRLRNDKIFAANIAPKDPH